MAVTVKDRVKSGKWVKVGRKSKGIESMTYYAESNEEGYNTIYRVYGASTLGLIAYYPARLSGKMVRFMLNGMTRGVGNMLMNDFVQDAEEMIQGRKQTIPIKSAKKFYGNYGTFEGCKEFMREDFGQELVSMQEKVQEHKKIKKTLKERKAKEKAKAKQAGKGKVKK